MSTIPDAWQCEKCGEIITDNNHDIEWCRPQITDSYCCPCCGKTYASLSEAFICHKFDIEAHPPPPSAEELERAGQMRLMP